MKEKVSIWQKANPDRVKANQAKYRLTSDQARTYWLSTKGLTQEQYNEMLAAQDYGCFICGRKDSGRDGDNHFIVDHDHTCCSGQKSCGKCVRGLLCHKCNFGLGCFEDNGDRLIAAAAYLIKHENVLGEVI